MSFYACSYIIYQLVYEVRDFTHSNELGWKNNMKILKLHVWLSTLHHSKKALIASLLWPCGGWMDILLISFLNITMISFMLFIKNRSGSCVSGRGNLRNNVTSSNKISRSSTWACCLSFLSSLSPSFLLPAPPAPLSFFLPPYLLSFLLPLYHLRCYLSPHSLYHHPHPITLKHSHHHYNTHWGLWRHHNYWAHCCLQTPPLHEGFLMGSSLFPYSILHYYHSCAIHPCNI